MILRFDHALDVLSSGIHVALCPYFAEKFIDRFCLPSWQTALQTCLDGIGGIPNASAGRTR
jgi:hypothetical protein